MKNTTTRKNKSVYRYIAGIFTVLLAVSIFSCQNPDSFSNEPQNTPNTTETASVVLNLPGISSSLRSIMAATGEDRITRIVAYHILISEADGNIQYDEVKPISTLPLTIDKLPIGETIFVITALDAENIILAEGTATVNLVAGRNDIKITLIWKPEDNEPGIIIEKPEADVVIDIEFEILYTVSFYSNGGSNVENHTVLEGTTVTEPIPPTKTGYDCIFEGWYDENLTTCFAFSTPITANISLYAKWRPYELGETGPGGGKIFYRDEAGFTQYEHVLDNIRTDISPFCTIWMPYEQGFGSNVIRISYFDDPYQYFDYTFVNEGTTCYYLEAASFDMDTTLFWWAHLGWNGIGIAVNTETATGIGMGRRNTSLILATSPLSAAAKACNDYLQGGKNDWFLPSKDELNMLYINRAYVSNLDGICYWSSSGASSSIGVGTFAWCQYLNEIRSGIQANVTDNYLSVRAIRAF